MHHHNQKKSLYVIVGLGKTGLSCVHYLLESGHLVAVTDDRAIPPGLHELRTSFPQVPVCVGEFSEEMLSQADVLVLSPGVPKAHPLVQAQINRGACVLGDIELFAKQAKAPIVAITGSNGKSTVTTLVGEMAKEAGLNVGVGGNLGTPALSLLSEEVALYVLELSSFQLETTDHLKANTAVVLNISPDHLDRYPVFDDYVKAKQKIYVNCKSPVFNREDLLSARGLQLSEQAVSFGLDRPLPGHFGMIEADSTHYFAYGEEKLFSIHDIKLRGRHQWSNVLASLALGKAIGLPFPAMREAAKKFPGLPHRCEWIGSYQEVDWYNDSKGTNVGAAIAAIEGLGQTAKGKLILIAGGVGKQADFSDLRSSVSRYVKSALLLGRDANQIAKALDGTCDIRHIKDFYEAVGLANQLVEAGDIVLLSPACASFDMFEGFDKRGEAFIKTVRAFYE